MSDEIEVTVEVPDTEIEDSNNNGIADGVELGQAIAQADAADEQSEEALERADVALDIATVASDNAYDAQTEIASLREASLAQSATIQAQSEQIAGLIEVVKGLADVALAESADSFTEQPPEEAPASGHWLTKKIFGGSR